MANWEVVARRKANKYGLNPDYFNNQMFAESAYDDDVIYGRQVSSAGAQGIAQMMPDTAKAWGVDPLKPRQALDSAAKHMADYVKQFGSYRDALIAYNWGPGNVASKSQNLPEETRNYIEKVLGGGNQTQLNAPRNGGGGGGGGGNMPRISPVEYGGGDDGGGIYDVFSRMNDAVGKPDYLSSFNNSNLLQSFSENLSDVQEQTASLMQDLFSRSSGGNFKVNRLSRGRGSSGPQIPSASGGDITPTGTRLVAQAIKRANIIDAKEMPYLWGGGHAGKITNVRKATPLDCSGAVSAVLGIDPRVSGDFGSIGKPGRVRKGINIFYNPEHVLMEINGHFFGTSSSNPGGGAGWIDKSVVSDSYLSRFKVRHL